MGISGRCSIGRRSWSTASVSTSRRSEEHTSELQSPCNLVCRLLLEKKKNNDNNSPDSLYSINTPPPTPLCRDANRSERRQSITSTTSSNIPMELAHTCRLIARYDPR